MKALHLMMGASMGLLLGFVAARAAWSPPQPPPAPTPPVEAAPVPTPAAPALHPSCVERDDLLARLHAIQPLALDRWPAEAGDPRVMESQLAAGAARVAEQTGAVLLRLDCDAYPCVAVFAEGDTAVAAVVRADMGPPRGVATQTVDGVRHTAFSFTAPGVPQGGERTWQVLRESLDASP